MNDKTRTGTSDPYDPARLSYWNKEYAEYWRRRVAEANSADGPSATERANQEGKVTSDSVYADAISLLQIDRNDVVLELGCGFGRSLPVLAPRARQVAAVDISQEMINLARAAHKFGNVEFHVCPSEKLPFPPETFDVVICFAAFDAMFQTAALAEMNRVAKMNGRILITGKNDNYLDDDEAAISAEIGARTKGHPNYFTDVERLLGEVHGFGFSVATAKYFLRRGDLPNGRASADRPAKFYEYMLVLRKTSRAAANVPEIASDVSRTFGRRFSVSKE